MARDDEIGLPRPPAPPAPPEPQVLPPMPGVPAPSGPPTLPPDFRSRPVDPERDGPPGDLPDLGAASYGMPRNPQWPYWKAFVTTMGICAIMFLGVVGWILVKPVPPQGSPAPSGIERTVELPPGQRLISAEIGNDGEVYYRYTPLQPGEQPRNSTIEGRSSGWQFLGKVHFIERAAQ
ncbi:hypothetical protein HY635_02485 [Candidatus Uhrbacteria bacterium]|nr:hypothetical protein [Candidatus Uhrbacteria bacterium]